MIPPSTWLSRAERVDDPADVVDRGDPLDATSPVSTSTATSATWTPNVSTRIPVGFGPRAPLPRICAVVEQAEDVLERPRAAVGADDLAVLERGTRSSVSKRCAASSRICRAASAAAERTAGPIDGIVDEPAEIDAYGPRAESPSSTRTRSSGRPSSSAAICAIAVRVPVPMSCIAVTTVARPSDADAAPRRTRAGRRRRTRSGSRARRRASTAPRCARAPRAAAPSAARRGGSTPSGSWRRTAARRSGRASAWLRRRSSSGSRSSLAASSSSRHSSPNVPSTKPGARKAAIGGVFSLRAVRRPFARSRRRRASASGPSVVGEPARPSRRR